MPTDTKLNNLIINYLTEEQYKGATKNENELYLTPDDGSGTIETIDGTWDGDDFSLSKVPSSYPFTARLTMADTGYVTEVFFCDAVNGDGVSVKIGLYNDAENMYAFFYYPEDTSQNSVVQHPYMRGTSTANKVLTSKADKTTQWQDLKTINSQSLLGSGNIDIGGDEIEVIKATASGETPTATLEKKITKIPTIVNMFVGGQESPIYSFLITSQLNESDTPQYFGRAIGTSALPENSIFMEVIAIETTLIFNQFLPLYIPEGASTSKPLLPTYDGNSLTWKDYPNLSAYQPKTHLHTLTAKGATLSMSFTYPSTNELVVDSPQDATTVIKPTTDEYFPSPVVVIETKKISDSYNCIHYNGTLWKFAMWDGSSFTDGEAVTTWADSVVNVD